jgi:signal transduction histidine kinase
VRTLGLRLAGVDPVYIDLVFATAMLIELELVCTTLTGISTEHLIVTAVASLLLVIPLTFRRRSPGAALVTVAVVVATQALLGGLLLSTPISDQVGPFVVIIALSYSAGAWLDFRPSLVAFGVALALVEISQFLSGAGSIPSGITGIASAGFYAALAVTPPWLVARLVRRHTSRSEAFRELTELSSSELEVRQTAAIANERARIGSELQDVIAHSISAMVIQAGGARLLMDGDPNRAREAVLNVERTGREALADLRRLLGMLRKDDDPQALSPQPGLAQVQALIASVSHGDVVCDLKVVGVPIDMTPGVDLVAYRVVESALLAASARPSHRDTVTIRYAANQLEIEIVGDIAIPDLAKRMQSVTQRVALYRGSLHMMPISADGFLVQARLPLTVGIPA